MPRAVALLLVAVAALCGCEGGPQLTWAPPALDDPIRIEVPPEGGQWDPPRDRDCLVVMPDVPVTDTVRVLGCHDLVLIGGQTKIGGAPDGNPPKPGLYLVDYTGTLHVEGWRAGGSGLTDGIWASTRFRGTTAQIQNVYVTGLHAMKEYRLGRFAPGWPEPDEHPDVVQLWQGPTRFRADRVFGRSPYQGLLLDSTAFRPPEYAWNPARTVDLRRTYIALTRTGRSCYAYFQPRGAPKARLKDAYCSPGRRRWVVAVSPRRDHAPRWWSGVRRGKPPFPVLLGSPGLGYESPGYR